MKKPILRFAELLLIPVLWFAIFPSQALPRTGREGSILVDLPEGAFNMGSRDVGNEGPISVVFTRAYSIGKYEVTNDQFREFVNSSLYKPRGKWRTEYLSSSGKAPALDVTWEDSAAYCRWYGLRLPTEAEWERAARGPLQYRFPWGNQWRDGLCQSSVGHQQMGAVGTPAPVGSFPEGTSGYGCLDMAGNAYEWCSSIYKEYPYNPADGREDLVKTATRVIRGGSWYNNEKVLFRCTDRAGSLQTTSSPVIGFRVCRGQL